MRLGLVLLVLSASTMVGYAHPRRPPPPPDGGLKDPFGDSRWTCNTAKGWPKIKACLEKDHLRMTVLHDLEGAKLVSLSSPGATATTLRLYVQLGEQWQMASFFGANSDSSELLSFKRLGDKRYRIDQGTVMQTSAVVGAPGTAQRVWLRRQQTTVCTGSSCRSVITSCDAMVEGKSYWSFHGTLHAQDASLFVVGDKSRAGTLCAPPPSMFRQEPVGDPLE